jgi:small subunit ribosomal protein S3
MIEKKIIQEIIDEHNIDKFLRSQLEGVPVDKILVEKNPAKGDQITIETSLPGLVIGREGSKIKELTLSLKEKFNMTNPQIKISEIKNPAINSKLVAKMISRDLTRFGSQKFKLTAFKYMTQALRNGAQGIEIRISGKLPSSRAKSWRFSKGYLKKTGYISDFVMEEAVDSANLKTGTLGIKVKILTDDIVLPDTITLIEDVEKIEKAKQDKKELQEKDREEFEQKMKERKMKFRKQKMEEAKK